MCTCFLLSITNAHIRYSSTSLDLIQYIEIRTGFFADGAKKIELTKGEELILTSDYDFKGNNKKLACSYPKLASSVNPGQSVLVADGNVAEGRLMYLLVVHPPAT